MSIKKVTFKLFQVVDFGRSAPAPMILVERLPHKIMKFAYDQESEDAVERWIAYDHTTDLFHNVIVVPHDRDSEDLDYRARDYVAVESPRPQQDELVMPSKKAYDALMKHINR